MLPRPLSHVVALTALALAAPTGAQAYVSGPAPFLGPVTTYAGSACAQGVVDAGSATGEPPTYGTIACIALTARIGDVLFAPVGMGARPWPAFELGGRVTMANAASGPTMIGEGGDVFALTPGGVEVLVLPINVGPIVPLGAPTPVWYPVMCCGPTEGPVVDAADLQRLRIFTHVSYRPNDAEPDDFGYAAIFGIGLTPVVTAAPEPATLALTAGGLLAVAAVAPRRRGWISSAGTEGARIG